MPKTPALEKVLKSLITKLERQQASVKDTQDAIQAVQKALQ